MKTEMTEKEAREKLARLLTGQHAPYPWESLPDPQWEAVKAAWGLEFAPEPALPERLVLNAAASPGRISVPLKPAGVRPLTDHEEVAAVDRYNAYPTLRAAAEALTGLIRSNLAPATQSYIELETRALEAELAKGPK